MTLQPNLRKDPIDSWEVQLKLYDKDGDLMPASRWPKDGYNPFDPTSAPSDPVYDSRKRAIDSFEFWFGRRQPDRYTQWGY